MPSAAATLPSELRSLIKQAVALLGEVIRAEQGARAFVRIEKLRRKMAALRGVPPDRAYQVLTRNLAELRRLPRSERSVIAHAFTLMLELTNACENAYRTMRLQGHREEIPKHEPDAIIWVLTAHPTEARSPENVTIFLEIQKQLTTSLIDGFDSVRPTLFHLLEVAWRLPVARNRRPSVQDEAEHIYSIVLRPEILSPLISRPGSVSPVYIRSWVGGDKDGHPGVNQITLVQSLEASRARLLPFLLRKLQEIRATLRLLREPKLLRQLAALERTAKGASVIRAGDGRRMTRLRDALVGFQKAYETQVGTDHPALVAVHQLWETFPGLVVPLELRESSDLIMEPGGTLAKMLKALARVASGGNPHWYARCLVVSMTSSLQHIQAAMDRVEDAWRSHQRMRRSRKGADSNGPALRIVPLFEQRDALTRASQIVELMLQDPRVRHALATTWHHKLEVMLGYSDSAKETGVLASRLEISDAMGSIDRVCRHAGITPLFFQGSGGSVDRGGGSIQEQTAWWPLSALELFKATVQGEMVERGFATAEIADRLAERIADIYSTRVETPVKNGVDHAAVRNFADKVTEEYQAKLHSPDFLRLVQQATAYRYLSVLKIGSRPAKRKSAKSFSLASLRAIPWVLSWTQTRVLFPTWWGVGKAWDSLSSRERRKLLRSFKKDPLFSSYVKLLGFTLAKVELPIWRLYLDYSGLPKAQIEQNFREFREEYDRAVGFVRAVSRSSDLLWFRRWLGESIRLRSPMIHPLNLIQILAFSEPARPDLGLVRETVTGIASGMLTTG